MVSRYPNFNSPTIVLHGFTEIPHQREIRIRACTGTETEEKADANDPSKRKMRRFYLKNTLSLTEKS